MTRGLFVAGAVLGALVGAADAPTKEGARARLETKLPLAAPPGKTIDVAWSVDVPDASGGRRGFSARYMFVRLLSRTGAGSTLAFGRERPPLSGRHVARAKVPAGGIGGVRVGLRGTTDVYFPLENDPFTSPGGVRCDVAAVTATLRAFVRAYNRGDLARLDRLFSHRRFAWYSSGGPGVRRVRDAEERATLMDYFRRRHLRHDRLAVLTFRFNGYEPQRELGHFQLTGRRRADDFRGGQWFPLSGKGALDCSKPPVTIGVLSLGPPS